MKNLLLVAIAIFGFSAVSFGQSSVTTNATASATIMKALTLTNNRDMNFGRITVGAVTGGTVVLTPAAATTLTPTGVTLFGGTVTSAQFSVTGEKSTVVTIEIPTTVHQIKLGGSGTIPTEIMDVSAFTSTPATTGGTGTTTLDGTGIATIYIGATLNIIANQEPGIYSNSTGFPVTVHYN